MRVSLLLPCLFTLVILVSPIRAADKDKLRKAAILPTLSVQYGIGFNSVAGLVMMGGEKKAPKNLQALRKKLKGAQADADVYAELSKEFSRRKNREESKKYRHKAIELYERQLGARSNDGLLHAKLGKLLQKDHPEKAEKLLRRAVELAPKELTCWQALASYHEYQVFRLILGERADRTYTPLPQIIAILQKKKFTDEELRSAQEHIRQILKCYDEAVKHCPRNPQAYIFRAANVFAWKKLYGPLIDGPERNRFDGTSFFKAISDPEVLSNLRQAMQLDPENYTTVGAVAALELMSAVHTGRIKSADEMWSRLPESSQKTVLDCLNRLDKLTHSQERKRAVGSAHMLATVYLIKNQPDKALAYCRRIVQLDPQNDKGWEMLTALLGKINRAELLPAAKQWVRQNDTAYTRYVLAKAYDLARDNANTEKEIRESLRHDPKYFHANLGLAVMLLRRSDKSNTLPEAEKYLKRAYGLVDKNTSPTNKSDWAATYAIYLGLAGQEKGAKKVIDFLQRQYPKNQVVIQIWAALESQ